MFLYAVLAASFILVGISAFTQAGTSRPLRYYTDSGNTALTYYTNGSGDVNKSYWGINTDNPLCDLDINGTICLNASGVYYAGVNITASSADGNNYPTSLIIFQAGSNYQINLSRNGLSTLSVNWTQSGSASSGGNISAINTRDGWPVRFKNSTEIENFTVTCNAGYAINTLSNNSVCVNVDPQIGTLTPNKWCVADAGGTLIDCTQNNPADGIGGNLSSNGTAGYIPQFTNNTLLTNSPLFVSGAQVLSGANVIPTATDTYSLGNNSSRWKDVWLTNSSLYLDTNKLSSALSSPLWNGINILLATDLASLITNVTNLQVGTSSINTTVNTHTTNIANLVSSNTTTNAILANKGSSNMTAADARAAVNNSGLYNISISCANITGGPDTDFCTDSGGGGGNSTQEMINAVNNTAINITGNANNSYELGGHPPSYYTIQTDFAALSTAAQAKAATGATVSCTYGIQNMTITNNSAPILNCATQQGTVTSVTRGYLIDGAAGSITTTGTIDINGSALVAAIGNWSLDKSSYALQSGLASLTTNVTILVARADSMNASIISIGNWTLDKTSYTTTALGDSRWGNQSYNSTCAAGTYPQSFGFNKDGTQNTTTCITLPAGSGNTTLEVQRAVNNSGLYNISISCANITGGPDSDFCTDTGGSGSPGGSTNTVQYNNGGGFQGDNKLYWINTSGTLTTTILNVTTYFNNSGYVDVIDRMEYEPPTYLSFWACGGNFLNPLAGNAVSSGTIAQAITNSTHPGVCALLDSTTSNGGYRIQSDNAQLILAGGENYSAMVNLRSNNIGNMTARFGFMDTATSAEPTDGCHIRVTWNRTQNPTFIGRCTTAGLNYNTTTTYTGTNNTWYKVNVDIQTNGTVYYRIIDGSTGTNLWTEMTNTTRMPSATGQETGWGIIATEGSGAAATNLVYIDYMWLKIGRLLTRP